MNHCLRAGEKTSANPGTRCAKRQGCSEPPSVGNSSGGDDWRRRHGVDHGRNEGHGRDGASYVSAGFPALGDHDIDTTIDSATGVGGRAHRVQHDRARRLCPRHQRGWILPKERNDANAFIETRFKPFLLWELQVEVDTEWSGCEGTRIADLPANRVDICPPGREHSKCTCVAYGCRESWSNGARHRSLYDRHLDPNALAERRLHGRASRLLDHG